MSAEKFIISKWTITAILLLLAGIIIILAVPSKYEGPMLLYINDEHSIRLFDAVGLVLAVPSWFYLGMVLVMKLKARRKSA